MNLRDFEYVAAVDTYQNFSKAAKHCNVTQPTLSNQVKKLEQELGESIFVRQRKAVTLTEFGKVLVGKIRNVLNETNEIKRLANSRTQCAFQTVKIGMTSMLAHSLTQNVINSFHATVSNAELEISDKEPDLLLESLLKEDLDIIITPKVELNDGLKFTDLFTESIYLAMSSSNELSRQKTLTFKDIDFSNFLLSRSIIGTSFEQIIQKNAGLRGRTKESFEIVYNRVAHSEKLLTIVPATDVKRIKKYEKELVFKRINNKSYDRHIGIITNFEIFQLQFMKDLIKDIRKRVQSEYC